MTDTQSSVGTVGLRQLAEELREYTAMKYAGDCKCGKYQLVPRALVERIYHTLNSTVGVAQAATNCGEPDGWIVKNRTGGVELFLDHAKAVAAFSAWGSSIRPIYASPPAPLPAGETDHLARLWKAITDNTTPESFWLAEILLHEITKETGYTPALSSQTHKGEAQ